MIFFHGRTDREVMPTRARRPRSSADASLSTFARGRSVQSVVCPSKIDQAGAVLPEMDRQDLADDHVVGSHQSRVGDAAVECDEAGCEEWRAGGERPPSPDGKAILAVKLGPARERVGD